MATAKADLEAGVWNGGIYNSLTMLVSVLNNPDVKAGQVIAAFDNGVPAQRLQLIPDYRKERRERKSFLTPEQKHEAYRQIDQLREVLKHLGVVCVSFKAHEADDVVAELVARLGARAGDERPVVVTSDRDLWQTINPDVGGAVIYDLTTSNLIDAKTMDEMVHVKPNEFLLYKALLGDDSDSIPGVPGLGEKYAAQLIESFRSDEGWPEDPADQLDYILRKIDEESKTTDLFKRVKAVVENADQLRRSFAAMGLRGSFDSAKYGDALIEAMMDRPPVRKIDFLRQCQKYGLGDVLGSPERFVRPFREAAERRDRE